MATHLGVGAGILTLTGLGSPEGVVTAPVSSTYRRRDGVGLTAFYVKQSGAGAVGWVPTGSPSDDVEYLLIPELRTAVQGTRVFQAPAAGLYNGGSLVLRRRVSASRLIFRLTAATVGVPAATLRVLLFQFPQGESDVAGGAPRVATASVVLAAGGAQTLTVVFAEGTVTFEAGIVYALFGIAVATTGSATMRVYGTDTYDLLTANVDASTHPVNFTTTILTSVLPATFDPLPAPGEAVASNLNLTPVLRLRA